jgi:PKD repeat protein
MSLRVTDPFGRGDTMSVPLTVNPQRTPSAPIAEPRGTVTTGTLVNFTSTDGGGLPGLTWDWLITGPATIELPNAGRSINHVFTAAGSWTVRVTATDALGGRGTNQTFVTVVDPVPPLNANFGWVSIGPLQIQFTNTSTGPLVTAWAWNFGDPDAVGNGAEQNPLVTYSGAGSFSVTLTAIAGTQIDPVTILRTVLVPPIPPS